MKHPVSRRGFTLIELLVVITIIVILLALLAPALDKAIYQAQLAQCGANLHGTVSGVTQYAAVFQRRYPYRQALASRFAAAVGPGYWGENILMNTEIGDATSGPRHDDRPSLEGYVPLPMLVDPLSGDALDYSRQANGDGTIVITNYSLWWDFAFTNAQNGGPGSTRIGNPIQWEGKRLTMLIGDRDLNVTHEPHWSNHSHPDKRNHSRWVFFQNDEHPAAPAGSGAAGISLTAAWWEVPNQPRGPVDSNFGFSDGSAERFTDAPFDAEQNAYPGLMRVPDIFHKAGDGSANGNFTPAYFLQVPQR